MLMWTSSVLQSITSAHRRFCLYDCEHFISRHGRWKKSLRLACGHLLSAATAKYCAFATIESNSSPYLYNRQVQRPGKGAKRQQVITGSKRGDTSLEEKMGKSVIHGILHESPGPCSTKTKGVTHVDTTLIALSGKHEGCRVLHIRLMKK